MREIELNVDLYKKTYEKIQLKQYDTTRITVTITNENFDLSDKTIKYIFERIDGSVVRDVGTVEDNKIIFNLDEICLQLNGQAEFEVQVYDDEDLISSFIVPVEIEPSNMNNAEAVDKGLYLKDIDDSIKTMHELIETVEYDLENGVFKGDKGDTGEQGIPGISSYFAYDSATETLIINTMEDGNEEEF